MDEYQKGACAEFFFIIIILLFVFFLCAPEKKEETVIWSPYQGPTSESLLPTNDTYQLKTDVNKMQKEQKRLRVEIEDLESKIRNSELERSLR